MIHVDKTLKLADLKQNVNDYSKRFSEGNPKLEQVLKLLWASDIETRGCCAGHDNIPSKKEGYICINPSYNTDSVIKLLSLLDKESLYIGYVSLDDDYGVTICDDKDLFDNFINALNRLNLPYMVDQEIANNINEFVSRRSHELYNLRTFYEGGILSEAYLKTTDVNEVIKYEGYENKLVNEKNHFYDIVIKTKTKKM